MFSTLLNKEFLPQLSLFLALGSYLYFIERLAELFLRSFLGYTFFYAEMPFLKLVYILLGVVSLAFFTIIVRAKHIDMKRRKHAISSFLLTLTIGAILSMLVHLYQIDYEMAHHGSLFQLESSYLYYLHDYIFVVCFGFAGFLFLRPMLREIGM